jgi:hypothetical protein
MQTDDALKHDLFLLVGFLLSSSHGLYDEPPSYGPFRLLDAAARMLEVMQAHDLSDAFLQELKSALDQERFGAMGGPSPRDLLNDLLLRYALELKERTGSSIDS